ncbi:MAG TPA: BNR-4 repeat-containing protein [Thermoguttaceae bacterium]|nr:BNR-4 repeat-containing protein [Thermoguttaceae bacterium]
MLVRSSFHASLAFVAFSIPPTVFALVVPDGVVLSENGSGRATGYEEANKIISWGDRTHVAWLDSTATGFEVRMRTLDRATGQWSSIHSIGPAEDNHGGPALTVDSQGYLHIAYYPHHGKVHYRKSVRPNDSSEWQNEVLVGQTCTYPTLVCGPDDTLYMTVRESNISPWVTNLYTKPSGGPWSSPRAILAADVGNYAHFMDAMAWSPDHQTLHLSCRFYDGNTCHAIGYMKSADFGQTWTRHDGVPITLPGTADTMDVVEIIPDENREYFGSGSSLRAGTLAVDSSGVPHILYNTMSGTQAQSPRQAWIATPNPVGGWQKQSLNPWIDGLPEGWGAMVGGLTIDIQGRMQVVLTIGDDLNEPQFGEPSSELVWLESLDNGQSWTSRFLTEFDPDTPHWLPSVERPTGFNMVDVPGVIYTSGDPGAGLGDMMENDVIWLPLVADIPGDATRDGKVDMADAAVLARNWGKEDATAMMGDFDGDGTVGPKDASILAANWNPAAGESNSVPEPSLLAAICAATATIALRRRDRS